MTDETAALVVAEDEIAERLHGVDLWNPRLAALLHGRHYDALYAVLAKHPTLGKLAVEEAYFVNTHLRGLLYHPLYASHILGWCYGKMDVSAPSPLLWQRLKDTVTTMFVGNIGSLGTIETTLPVHQEQLVAATKA